MEFSNPDSDPGRLQTTLLSPQAAAGSGWVAIISVWVCVLFSVEYWRDIVGVSHLLAGSGASIFGDGEWWRLATTMFVHADTLHLAANAVALALLSYLVYGYFGSVAYPVLTFLAGILVNAVAILTYPPQVTLVGISGVVFILAGFWLASFFLIERRHSVAQRLLRCFGFSLIMLIPATVEPTISYRTHLIGALVGILFGMAHFYWRIDWIRAHEVYVRDDYSSDFMEPSDEDDPSEPLDPSSHTIH